MFKPGKIYDYKSVSFSVREERMREGKTSNLEWRALFFILSFSVEKLYERFYS